MNPFNLRLPFTSGVARLDRGVTLLGGASMCFPTRLELKEESLMSEATLAESEPRSSHDSALLEEREEGLRRQPPTD